MADGNAPGVAPSKTALDRAYDLALAGRSAKGDHRAFAELVKRHERRARVVAHGIVRDTEDARDVVQDAFIRVWNRIADFDGQASFSTWLYRIVYNLSIDVIRRRPKWQAVELSEHVDLSSAPDDAKPWRSESDPLSAIQSERLAATMQRCLVRLSLPHRTILVLRDVEGMTYDELSGVLEIPKGTVMSRLFHARHGMQALLREALGDEAPPVAENVEA